MNIKNIAKTKSKNIDLFVIFNLAIPFLFTWLGKSPVVTLILISGISMLVLTKKYFFRLLNKFLIIFLIFTIFYFSLLNSLINLRLNSLFYPFYFLYSIYFANYLFDRPKKVVFSAKLFYFALTIWFVLMGLNNGFMPYNIYHYFPNASQNVVITFFIFTSFLIVLTETISYPNKISSVHCFITFIIALLCGSRVGIVVSFLLNVFAFIYNSLGKINFYFLIRIFILGILFIFLILYIYPFLQQFTNFSRGLSSPRSDMNAAYLDSLNLIKWINGNDYRQIEVFKESSSIAHNSFIVFHSNSGIAAIIFVIYILLHSFKSLLFNSSKTSYLSFGILLLFLFRSFYDTVAFVWYFDYLIFLSIQIISRKKVKNYRKV